MQVTVLIGDPVFLDDLLVDKDDPQHVSTGILYDAVSLRIGHQLQELKVQVDRLALEQLSKTTDSTDSGEHGSGIWQQIDWEAFGIGHYMSEEHSPNFNQIMDVQPIGRLDQSPTLNSARISRIRLFDEGGIISRIHGFMNPSELMGFAARGLFMNGRITNESGDMFRGWAAQ